MFPEQSILSVCLSSYPSIYLSIYLSVYLSIHPSVRPSVCPSACPFIDLPTYLWLYSLCGPWPLFSFLIYTVGRNPWTGVQPVARPLPTYRTIQTQNKPTQTSKPREGFEPTIPVFERVKTAHALGLGLDHAATVID
jgi:hypothetical protein